jgi:hypothetical protein
MSALSQQHDSPRDSHLPLDSVVPNQVKLGVRTTAADGKWESGGRMGPVNSN